MQVTTSLECHPAAGDQLKKRPVTPHERLLPLAGLRAILHVQHCLAMFLEGWVDIKVRY
jgi:hypothetical protein